MWNALETDQMDCQRAQCHGAFQKMSRMWISNNKDQKATLGSVLSVHWECEKNHKGKWSSCTDVRECPLIIFLFLHAHYSLDLHIQTSLIGPLCSTFKCPIKPLTMTFSLATLFQSLMKNIKNNRKQQLMTYICKLNSVIQLICPEMGGQTGE